MPATGTNSSGTSHTLAVATATTIGTSASSEASVQPNSARLWSRYGPTRRELSIAIPTAVSTLSAMPNAAAAASAAGRAAAMSVGGWGPATRAKAPAAAEIASTDCDALKSALSARVRLTASAATQPATYAITPGSGPNIKTIASAKPADTVSSSV